MLLPPLSTRPNFSSPRDSLKGRRKSNSGRRRSSRSSSSSSYLPLFGGSPPSPETTGYTHIRPREDTVSFRCGKEERSRRCKATIYIVATAFFVATTFTAKSHVFFFFLAGIRGREERSIERRLPIKYKFCPRSALGCTSTAALYGRRPRWRRGNRDVKRKTDHKIRLLLLRPLCATHRKKKRAFFQRRRIVSVLRERRPRCSKTTSFYQACDERSPHVAATRPRRWEIRGAEECTCGTPLARP